MNADTVVDRGQDTPFRYLRLHEQAARLVRLGAWECDLASERLTWTDGVYALFELPQDTPLKRAAIVDLYEDDSRRDMEAMRAEAIRSGRGCAVDLRIRTMRGESRWMRLSIDVALEAGRAVRLFGAKQDITAEVEARERLRQLAERDVLTGLANRAVFDARYRMVVADGLNHGFAAALALIDLDRFKPVNDSFGHAAGDECLRQIAARLQRVFAEALLIARIGGDEFAVLLRAPLSPTKIRQMLRRAREALCRPLAWSGRCIDIGASIGATILGQPHLRKPARLFAEADAALYAAKAAGRRTVRIFADAADQDGMQDQARDGAIGAAGAAVAAASPG